ncbi:MAG: GNAT family N-acetyltransferase [Phycisphaeraceae bacterium]|nr:GNAT family N-acetyltransferase [Phycisphaeraceae bacterium]
MADFQIDAISPEDTELLAELYNRVFQPPRPAEDFDRRFLGRHNPLVMLATYEGQAVGFSVGFELKPDVFFEWLYGVLPDYRRAGAGSQLMEASRAWATEHHYAWTRLECHNQHRPMLHLAIHQGYDITGIRWDPDRQANLVIFERDLTGG